MIRSLKLPFVLLLFFCSSVLTFAQDDTRVSATWQVVKYDMAVTLPQTDAERSITAKAKVDAKNVSARPASTMTLRIGPTAEVTTVTVNGSPNEFAKREEKTGTGSLQQLIVRMPSVAPGGTVSVTVDYKLTVKDNSGLSAISSAGSQFLPLSYWYPTPNSWFFARGADFAPVKIQATVPSGTTVISAGTETGNFFESKLNGQPFFIVGAFDKIQGAGDTSIFLPKVIGSEERGRAVEIGAVASEAKTFLTGIFGSVDASLRLVAVKRGAGFSSGGTILFDESVLRRPKLDAQAVLAIAEGVAKTWLGGKASISGDGGGAVREGLARFLAVEFIQKKYGKDVADVERLRQRVSYAAVVQRDSPINTVSPLDDYYYAVVSNKAAMVWRLLERKVGSNEFYEKLKGSMEDGTVTLSEIRAAFPAQKEFLDNSFDQITDLNLLAGLPLQAGGESKVALRNTGAVDVTVDVEALLDNGQRMVAAATVPAKSFGEVIFKTPAKLKRVEIDREKLYPQTDFSDDVAPRELTDSDPLLAVKRFFDKQDYANAEKTARIVLADFPRFDDVRILLARSLLALNRTADAEKEFKAVLDEKLPTSRSIGWALVGLADAASKNNQAGQAATFATEAIKADAEYGASLAARTIRSRSGVRPAIDPSVAAFFDQWDKAAAANQKAQLDSLTLPGEASRFSGGVAGQTAAWKTQIIGVDRLDENTILVETSIAIKLLNRDPQSGTAVFRLFRVGNSWKIASVDVFEVH